MQILHLGPVPKDKKRMKKWNIQIGESDKCEKLEWFDINELPNNIDIKSKNDLKEISQGIFYDNSDFINVN